MPSGLNTYGVAQAIQGLLQGATWTAVGGVTTYANVFIGEQKDYTNKTPCVAIRFRQGATDRYSTGGQSKDYPHFYIRDYIDFTNVEAAAIAEQLLFASRDASIQIFVKSVQLGAVAGIVVAKLVHGSETSGYLPVNKHWYRVREYTLEVAYQYGVSGGFVP